MRNRHGLGREVPSAVKREVRQRCAFGCICCRASIYEYDHFDPEFADAHEHRPEGIVLLCPTCHALKTKGIITRERIAELYALPIARRVENSRIILPHFKSLPALRLGGGGGVLIEKTPIPLRVNGTSIVEFLPPEKGSDVTRVNAWIGGNRGHGLLQIVKNEWVVGSGIWDFEWVGHRMTVRDHTGATAMQLFIAPPSYIGVEHLHTMHEGWRIRATETEFQVGSTLMHNVHISRFRVGIQLSSKTDPSWAANGFGIHFQEAA